MDLNMGLRHNIKSKTPLIDTLYAFYNDAKLKVIVKMRDTYF